MQLGEINIICTDLEKSRKFYCDILGFEPLAEEGDVALHMELEDARFLLLAVAKENCKDASYCQRAAFGFDLDVEDLPALCKKLDAAGVPFERESDGKSAFIRDPDGLVIELIQMGAYDDD